MEVHIESNPYYRHFLSQVGGELPVFRGSARYQRGDGIGDIFRALGRFLFPIAVKAGEKFIGNTAQSLQKGQPLQDALKSSIMPTLSTAAGTALNTLTKRGKRGNGRKRSRAAPKRKRAVTKKKLYKKRKVPRNRSQQKQRKKSKKAQRSTSSHAFNF